MATGLPVLEPGQPAAGALALEFSPDGYSLAVAFESGAIQLLETATGRPRGAPLPHAAGVPIIAFDPSGQLLLLCLP